MLLTLLLGTGSTPAQNYVLNAEAGSFSLTGQAATLQTGRNLNAESGAFTVTGQAATLARQRQLDAQPTSFSYTGQPATLTRTFAINAASGTFSITGQNATLLENENVAAEFGAFIITGQQAQFYRGLSLNAQAGSFTVTGQAAELIVSTPNRILSADPGTYTLTGVAATLARARNFNAEGTSFTLTGAPATLGVQRNVNASVGSFNVLGQPATLSVSRVLKADAANTADGYAATGYVDDGYAFQPGYQIGTPYVDDGYVDFGYTGYTGATLLVAKGVVAQAGSFTITGMPAEMTIDRIYVINDADMLRLTEIWARLEMDIRYPVTITDSSVSFGTVTQSVSPTGSARIGDSLLLPDESIQPTQIIQEIWQRLGLDPVNPLVQDDPVTSITAGAVNLSVTSNNGTLTVVRQ